jgi:hypothetical protein
MKVNARHQVAYEGKLYMAGDEIDMDEKDVNGRYANDVEVAKSKKVISPKNKKAKSINTK